MASGHSATGVRARTTGESAGRIAVDAGGSLAASGDASVALDLASTSIGGSAGEVTAQIGGSVWADAVAASGLRMVSDGETASNHVAADIGGSLMTQGSGSQGLRLQSISGSGSAGDINLAVADDVVTSGAGATGAAVFSEGGTSGGSLALTLGADLVTMGTGASGMIAASAGDLSAGDVVATLAGAILSEGEQSSGLSLSSLSLAGDTGSVSATVTGEASSTGKDSIGLNLVSNAATNAGDVNLSVGGILTASGEIARGASLRSSGGLTSGNVTFDVSGMTLGEGDGVTVIELISTAARSAGDIVTTLGDTLFMSGQNSRGVALTSSSEGVAGSVTLQTKALSADGDQSSLVVAQSIGGSRAGDVTIELDGDVNVLGVNSTAVTARSVGAEIASLNVASTRNVSVASANVGNITVSNRAGQQLYAGAGGIGVLIDGGADNRLTLRGLSMTADGLYGNVVAATTGNDKVENFGVFYGQFDLGGGTNIFTNNADAILVPGPVLITGASDSVLINSGAIIPGDMENVQSTRLTGSFEQTATGETYASLDVATGQIDQILATGNVKLDGKVYVDLLNPGLVPAGDFSKVLFSGKLGLEDTGLKLITQDSLVIGYALDYSLSGVANLNYAIDFTIAGLGENQTLVSDYINRIQSDGSSPELADAVVSLLYQTDAAVYGEDLVELSPEFYAQQQAQLVRSSQVFGNRLMGCRQDGGAFKVDKEGRCAWVEADREKSDYSDNSDFQNSEFDTSRYAMGVEQTFADTLTFGFAASYEDVDGNGNNKNWNSNGDTTQAGVSARYGANEASITGVLSYGWGSTNTSRNVSVTDVTVSSADRDMSVLAGIVRLGYDFGSESVYVRTALDLGFSQIDADSVQEEGSGPLDLYIENSSQTHGWVQPSVRGGMDMKLSGGQTLRYYGGLGVQYYFRNEDAQVEAKLVGAPAGVAPLEMNVDIGETTFNTMAGIDLVFENEITVEFQLIYRQADELDIRGGHLRLSMPL